MYSRDISKAVDGAAVFLALTDTLRAESAATVEALSGLGVQPVLPHLVALSKRMMTAIRCNMTFSMALNFIAIVLAIRGTLNPVVGGVVVGGVVAAAVGPLLFL